MHAPRGPLTIDELMPSGPLRRLGQQVFLHETIDSTNAFLLARAATAGDGAVAWAEFQTAGRGRLGRRWEAPRGSAVLLSVLLHEDEGSPALALGPMLAAVAACEAIETATDCSPAVRWPNDIVLNKRKLGGVLAESCPLLENMAAQSRGHATGPAQSRGHATAQRRDHATSRRAVVIGVGINCLQQRAHFSEDLVGKATSLETESTQPVNRAAIAAGLLARLDHWLTTATEGPDGWATLRSAWRAHCQDIGTRVTLEHDARAFAGTALDICENGDVIVELDEGGRRQFPATTTIRTW